MIPQALDSNMYISPQALLDGSWFSGPEIFDWVQASAPSGPLEDIQSCPLPSPAWSWFKVTVL